MELEAHDNEKNAKKIAKLINAFLDERGQNDTGNKMYSPKVWEERGEDYGTNSLLIITHDGGNHAPFFSHDYSADAAMEDLRSYLEDRGVYVEQCTSWYSAIYPCG
jgi:hypothetical protein